MDAASLVQACSHGQGRLSNRYDKLQNADLLDLPTAHIPSLILTETQPRYRLNAISCTRYEHIACEIVAEMATDREYIDKILLHMPHTCLDGRNPVRAHLITVETRCTVNQNMYTNKPHQPCSRCDLRSSVIATLKAQHVKAPLVFKMTLILNN